MGNLMKCQNTGKLPCKSSLAKTNPFHVFFGNKGNSMFLSFFTVIFFFHARREQFMVMIYITRNCIYVMIGLWLVEHWVLLK